MRDVVFKNEMYHFLSEHAVHRVDSDSRTDEQFAKHGSAGEQFSRVQLLHGHVATNTVAFRLPSWQQGLIPLNYSATNIGEW